MRVPKQLSPTQIQIKITRYCAYQDRCDYEVREKLYAFGLAENDVDEMIDYLIDEKYLDEERFVEHYVKGKFNMKRWGRMKIIAGLRSKRVSEKLIDKYLSAIEEKTYLATLKKLFELKNKALKEEDPLKRKQKIAMHLQSKGYELGLVMDLLN